VLAQAPLPQFQPTGAKRFSDVYAVLGAMRPRQSGDIISPIVLRPARRSLSARCSGRCLMWLPGHRANSGHSSYKRSSQLIVRSCRRQVVDAGV